MITCGVPFTQSLKQSLAALAADMADESPLASMIALPLCCTVSVNSPRTHLESNNP